MLEEVNRVLDADDPPQLWEVSPGLSKAEGSSTLQKVKAAPFVKQYRTYLEETGAKCSVGFNMGTADISFSLTFAEDTVEPETLRANILLAGLNFHPNQESIPDANKCLQLFYSQTKIAIVSRKFKKAKSLTIIVKDLADCWEPAKSTFSTKSAKYKAVAYSPSYLRLQEGENVGEVVEEMVVFFWRGVRSTNYIPSEALEVEVSAKLRLFFAAGVQGISNKFCVEKLSEDLRLYLLGKPGAGKSAFVAIFVSQLEAVLREYLDTDQTVSIVKVPLNAVTPKAIQQQALVKGLSDHSIERVIEQNIKEGRIVVVHMEENPEDERVQVQLDATFKNLFAKLERLYPMYRHHILVLNTSNHRLNDSLAASYGKTVVLSSPLKEEREAWMVKQVASLCGRDVLFESYPGEDDMRLLNMFCLTLASIIRSRCEGVVTVSGGNGKWRLASGSSVVGVVASANLFCYEESTLPAAEAQLQGVVDMSKSGLLSPAVVVVDDMEQAALVQKVCDRTLPSVEHVNLEVLEQEDSVLVFGSPREIRGGLFKTIDDCTCPNSPKYFKHVVVTVTVTVQGQFVLRELLEQGDKSRTHRLGVSKKGCVFILVRHEKEATEITPQVLSRAHLII